MRWPSLGKGGSECAGASLCSPCSPWCAAACGSRSGDDDDGASPEDGDDSEVATGESTDVGVTDDEIRIGVIADISGVVPGLFGAAPEAVEAYAAMVNDAGGINGRELVVEVFDTKTTDSGNAAAYEEACPKVFASVGSESAFDTGGLDAQRECGFPDLAGFKTDPDVQALPNVFPRVDPDYTGVGAARWFAEEFPDAVSNAAIFHGTPAGDRARRREPHRSPRVGRVGLQLPPAHRAAREQLHAARARDAEP